MERKRVFKNIVQEFEKKYSWLGHQASRELLLSAASWNIEKYSDTPMRYRNHVMLAWERGWLKSSILRKMAGILGDEMCSVVGKVTDAAMRGSISAGQFTPPKPLKTPIIISTEFGQTNFEDELLNIFLNMLEEGHTNISLNKIGTLAENQRRSIENQYDGKIEFGEKNEYDLKSNFVFWGATYDPSKLADDALRSRFNVVTPSKPLDPAITKALDKNNFHLSQNTIRNCRRMLQEEREVRTDFRPPDELYDEYTITPRESRDIQAYMAARNWWGLDVNPDVMESYIEHLKHSRRISTMEPEDRVFDLIFDNPMSYREIMKETGMTKKKVYRIIEQLPAVKSPGKNETQWVVYSRDDHDNDEEQSGLEGFLE